VRLEGFLSHTATDWAPNGARLVTLVGPNGAGKSTLASDALSYALFDEARGKTDQLVQLGATNMSVLVEFTFGANRYRVVRGRTTKSGGKSFLELHVADGDGWRPLTGDTIRDTEQLIGELLRLDAATFETAVLLGQGHANRFAEATAAERKRILGQVLGLDVYARAEGRARETARDLEAKIGAERSHCEQLSTRLLERGEIENDRGQALEVKADAENEGARATVDREAAEARIRELDVALAAADAVAGEIASLRAERAAAAADWHAASERKAKAAVWIADAELLLAAAPIVAVAVAALPSAKAELDRLVAAEAADRMLGIAIRQAEMALEAAGREHQVATADHRARYEAARRRVDELASAATTLEPVICEACGHHNVVDQAGIRPALETARAEFRALEGAEPKEPAALSRDRAALARLESRRREAPFDPAALTTAHAKVSEITAVAARGEALDAARATLEREQANVTAADVDQVRISERGSAIATRIAELEGKVADAAPFREERATLAQSVLEAKGRQEAYVARLRVADRVLAGLDAKVEQLAVVATERDELSRSLETAGVELARLRRLVTAFGVTGIPARIIESVLPELARYANELLADLRPGMTLELRAQRAKRDGSGVVEALDLVVRDDVGERPLALFSGGERMSVSLALAVGLSRLVARRAGSRIESLIVDEPDGLDMDARRAFGQALRIIAHRGELSRVVLVSHHADLAEFGDATYEIRKGPHGSVVEQVA
jgi:exonuclease SbcC